MATIACRGIALARKLVKRRNGEFFAYLRSVRAASQPRIMSAPKSFFAALALGIEGASKRNTPVAPFVQRKGEWWEARVLVGLVLERSCVNDSQGYAGEEGRREESHNAAYSDNVNSRNGNTT